MRNILSFLRGEQKSAEEIYCQVCGNDLTEDKTFVSETTGRVYCANKGLREDQGKGNCFFYALWYVGLEPMDTIANIRTPRQVQRLIRSGVIKHYKRPARGRYF